MGLYADRAMRIDSENAFKIGPYIRSLEAEGRDIVRCNLGEPDFPVPAFIKEEVKRQIDLDNTHYCDPQGIPSLRAAIAKQLSETRGIRAEAERVVVFPGGKPPIGLCQQTYCGPGDEVVYPSPGFPIYESFIPYVGATPVPVHLKEENAFSLSGAELASVLSEKTKLIFLNFPSNPTGGVASPEQLQEIARVIRDRCRDDVRIFSDEIYEHILFDGAPPSQHPLLSRHGEKHDPGERRLQELCLDGRPDRLGPVSHAGGGGGLQEPQHQLLLLHRRLQPGGGAPGVGIPGRSRSRSKRWWRSSRCAATWSWRGSTPFRGSAV